MLSSAVAVLLQSDECCCCYPGSVVSGVDGCYVVNVVKREKKLIDGIINFTNYTYIYLSRK